MNLLKSTLALVLSLSMAATMGGCAGKPAAPAGEGKPADAASAAAPAADKPVTITVASWGNDTEVNYFKTMMNGIENDYPNIKVEFQHYPSSDEFWQAIPIALAAKTGPDILAFSDEGNAEYMASGSILPIDDLMAKVEFDKGKFVESLWSGWTYNGKIHGVPYDTATSMFIINKDYMDAAGITETPKTMDELVTFAQKLNTPEHAGMAIWPMEFHLMQYVHAFGGDWGNGKTIDTPENAKGLQYVVDMFKKYNVAKTPQELGASWEGEAFAQGKVAMTTGGPWYVGMLKDAAPDMNYVVVPIPTGTKTAQSAYSHGLAITSQSKYPEEAMKVIKHMTRDEAQIEGIKGVGYAPAVKSLLPQYVESVPTIKHIYDALPTTGVPFSYPAKTTEFNAELCRGIEQIIFDEASGVTVESLLKELQTKYGA